MEIYGYVTIAHGTYDEWRSAVIGNKYDVDGFPSVQPFQCWDLVAEFWNNIGFPQNYPLTGPNQSAYECWSVNRDNNISYDGNTYFDLIEDYHNIKRGDVVVFDSNVGAGTGHIGFADQDYTSGALLIDILGENETLLDPSVQVVGYSLANFLGAFRYKGWQVHPHINRQKHKFPWYLYTNRRNSNYLTF